MNPMTARGTGRCGETKYEKIALKTPTRIAFAYGHIVLKMTEILRYLVASMAAMYASSSRPAQLSSIACLMSFAMICPWLSFLLSASFIFVVLVFLHPIWLLCLLPIVYVMLLVFVLFHIFCIFEASRSSRCVSLLHELFVIGAVRLSISLLHWLLIHHRCSLCHLLVCSIIGELEEKPGALAYRLRFPASVLGSYRGVQVPMDSIGLIHPQQVARLLPSSSPKSHVSLGAPIGASCLEVAVSNLRFLSTTIKIHDFRMHDKEELYIHIICAFASFASGMR